MKIGIYITPPPSPIALTMPPIKAATKSILNELFENTMSLLLIIARPAAYFSCCSFLDFLIA